MVDYGPGDEIVCVKQVGSTYIKDRIYLCTSLGSTTNSKAYKYRCRNCSTFMNETLCVWTDIEPIREACSCLFRKKLDFKKLCNVDETTKIKEDA